MSLFKKKKKKILLFNEIDTHVLKNLQIQKKCKFSLLGGAALKLQKRVF
jgi:hypothetical protein